MSKNQNWIYNKDAELNIPAMYERVIIKAFVCGRFKSKQELSDELGISVRTLHRYVNIFKLHDEVKKWRANIRK